MIKLKIIDDKIRNQYSEIYLQNKNLYWNRMSDLGKSKAEIITYLELLTCREMYTNLSNRYYNAKIEYEQELVELKYSDKLKNFKSLTAKEEQAKFMLKEKRLELNRLKYNKNKFNDYKKFLIAILGLEVEK